jgi:hypothetical protein
MAIAVPGQGDEGLATGRNAEGKGRTSESFRDVGPEGFLPKAGRPGVARAHGKTLGGAPKEISDMPNRYHTRLLSLAPRCLSQPQPHRATMAS